MKSLIRPRKALIRTSRKRRIRLARSLDRSGRARSVRVAHARVGSRSSAQSVVSATSPSGNSPTSEPRRSEALFQAAVKNFELGARAFQKRNYEKAKEIFEKLAFSGVAGVAERARVHLRLCEHKLSRPGPPPKKAEDLYILGVGALNSRRLDDAIHYLNKAHKSAPRLEHVCYALAAAYSLRGDAKAALQHLGEAISLRPQNRIQANRDEDFQALATDSRFKDLVFNSHH